MIIILLHSIYCFIATIFFAYIMNAPKRTLITTAIIAAVGYYFYELCMLTNNPMFIAYFVATVFISAFGEICSFVYKTPSIVIIFPAIIPLVPGIGLYQTVISFIEKDMTNFIKYGYETFIISIIIAAVVAIVKSIFNLIFTSTFKKNNHI